jgi:hypothetical protein
LQDVKSVPFHLDARFARYALLAGASIIAAKPAKGSAVVTLEPSPIDFTTGLHFLDVNNDGLTDFFFTGISSGMGETALTGFFLTVIDGSTFVTDGRVVDDFAVNDGGVQVAALGIGAVIGPNVGYQNQAAMGEFSATGILFAGLEFYHTSGFLHYGFAEFDPGQLLGYAYDSTANTPITTFDVTAVPEPGSLEMLALGAAGLEILLRKRARI